MIKDDLQKIKENLRSEMQVQQNRVETELDLESKVTLKQVQKLWKLIRIDFLHHQSKKMDMHKQVVKYQKYKMELIDEIKTLRERILKTEDDIFKCEMFRLNEPNDRIRNKNTYSRRILRKQQSSLPKYDEILDLDIDRFSYKELGSRKVNVQFEKPEFYKSEAD